MQTRLKSSKIENTASTRPQSALSSLSGHHAQRLRNPIQDRCEKLPPIYSLSPRRRNSAQRPTHPRLFGRCEN
ncbi:hypothetical protein EYC84_000943 [Monilinia fructicola]|uniref:Uncharacterized protein n=1 Tax=Monilinia fructicola TaxID=38448 RepID=A0A5M9JNA8_MONFR|nr:hypothetical protein EYC84_000943 [Monilinia fructicola]